MDAVLAAAEALFAARGYEGTTLADIAGAAGASTSSIYARFADKDAILREVHARFCAARIEAIDAGTAPDLWAEAPLHRIVDALVVGVVGGLLPHARLVKVFVVRGAVDPTFTDEARAVGAHLAGRVQALLADRRDEIPHPDPARAVDVALKALMGLVQQLALFGPGGVTGAAHDEAALLDDARRMVFGVLGLCAPAAARGGGR